VLPQENALGHNLPPYHCPPPRWRVDKLLSTPLHMVPLSGIPLPMTALPGYPTSFNCSTLAPLTPALVPNGIGAAPGVCPNGAMKNAQGAVTQNADMPFRKAVYLSSWDGSRQAREAFWEGGGMGKGERRGPSEERMDSQGHKRVLKSYRRILGTRGSSMTKGLGVAGDRGSDGVLGRPGVCSSPCLAAGALGRH